MKNRYSSSLRKDNQEILEVFSANWSSRNILAFEIKKMVSFRGASLKIIDLGCGEGDSSIPVLKKNPDISMDLLDYSQEMLDSAENRLSSYSNRLNFICADALKYLSENKNYYDIVHSSWVVHNFNQSDKITFFKKAFDSLKEGGKLFLMDKVYPNEEKEARRFFDIQIKRASYLSGENREKVFSHEKQDYSDDYRMDEAKVLDSLRSVGFSHVEIIDRLEKDVVLVAEK